MNEKIYFPPVFFICTLFIRHAYGFDIKGLQPVAPYGVFSTFSADSLKKGNTHLAPELKNQAGLIFSGISSSMRTV